ncbi:arginine deiminase family protein [Streptomyces katrae]|uniref:Arginine deiminase family protein n=1 Tax=Streptomyces katrae TaxID=68223 RepID=A0ABT7GT74_9ACTN|nr:arginine deiminase family protein [Streptomyces katrae]MDK9496114.1 arginine deiminase family protein [Streptomyces katrae]
MPVAPLQPGHAADAHPSQGRTIALVQSPRPVQPVEAALFLGADPAYDPGLAEAESEHLREVLTDCGLRVETPTDVLRTMPRESLLALAATAITSSDRERRLRAVEAARNYSARDLVEVITRRPHMRTVPDPDLASISPDTGSETFTTLPLFGMIFPRDTYVDLGGAVAIAGMRRADRTSETAVMTAVLERLRGKPAEAVLAAPHFLEGGDVAVCGPVAFVGIGFRSAQSAVDELWPLLERRFRTVVFVEDTIRRPAEFHLDSWFTLSPAVALVSKERLDDLRAARCAVYDTASGDRRVPERTLTVRAALDGLAIEAVGVGPSDVAACGANAFFVPGTPAVVVSGSMAKATVRALERHGCDVRRVAFTEHHKQSGGIHCAVNTVTPEPTEKEAA